MATSFSNCVYKGTKYCAIFCEKWLLVAFFLFAIVSGASASCVVKNGNWVGSLCHNGQAGNPQCSATSACDGTGNFFTSSCNDGTYKNFSYAQITSIGGVCATVGYGRPVYYYQMLCCTSDVEADSLRCVANPSSEGCTPPCDSTHWECSTRVEHSQTTIANDNVQCFGGDCYGGVYCEYVSESITDCTSDCGEFTTQSSRVPIRYEGACNPDNLTDDTECTGVRCMSFEQTGSYTLYKLCASREIINGERKFFPRMVAGGKGTCKNAGYPESNGDSSAFGGGSSSDSTQIPESCFTMGINCPPPDTTNYSSGDNRTPQNGCNCEPYDGLSSVSRIVCPDGSISIFMGSCDRWNEPPLSSSSTEPPESSGGSENPTSSGGALVGDWANYSQGQEIIGLLGAIANNTLQKPETQNINTINVALDDYTASKEDVDVPFNRTDSIYEPSYVVDTAGLRQAIFGRVTEQNTILDTLLHPVSKCPCFTFFSGGGSQAVIMGSHISLPKMVVDFASFHGFDLCHIISVIVTSLASVVAFFIGFSIFKNVSQ